MRYGRIRFYLRAYTLQLECVHFAQRTGTAKSPVISWLNSRWDFRVSALRGAYLPNQITNRNSLWACLHGCFTYAHRSFSGLSLSEPRDWIMDCDNGKQQISNSHRLCVIVWSEQTAKQLLDSHSVVCGAHAHTHTATVKVWSAWTPWTGRKSLPVSRLQCMCCRVSSKWNEICRQDGEMDVEHCVWFNSTIKSLRFSLDTKKKTWKVLHRQRNRKHSGENK